MHEVQRSWPGAGFVIGGRGLTSRLRSLPGVEICERVTDAVEAVDALVKRAAIELGGTTLTPLWDAAPAGRRDAAAMNGNWDKRISRRTLLRTGGAAAVVLYGGAIPSASAGPAVRRLPLQARRRLRRADAQRHRAVDAPGARPAQRRRARRRHLPRPLRGREGPELPDIVHRGDTRAGPEEAHTVHAEITGGLKPEHEYWYRFESEGHESPVGRFRTAPRYGTVPERLKFAFVSCQNYTYGYFSAFNDLVGQDDVELVVHLGDYIYEGPGLPPGPARTRRPAP